MPVTVVIGAQFGGEGKGKVTHFLAQRTNAKIAVRVGGTNSGHTVIDSSGAPVILRQLSTAALLPDITCALPAGSYINPSILFDEIELTGLPSNRLIIDPNAMIITEQDLKEEKDSSLRNSIGSTLSGTGAAVRRRIGRNLNVKLAKENESLQQFVKPVTPYLRDNLQLGHRIIIEGTQGFGLSLLHSKHYPYATSRDTTAAAFVSEAGLSPLDVDDIVLVMRSFPIRVGGNSGTLPFEINWDSVTEISGSEVPLIEYTSVTKTERRVAKFDPEIVRRAITVNQPTRIVLNHLDYLDASCTASISPTNKISKFIDKIESQIERKVDYLGLGPSFIIENPIKVRHVA